MDFYHTFHFLNNKFSLIDQPSRLCFTLRLGVESDLVGSYALPCIVVVTHLDYVRIEYGLEKRQKDHLAMHSSKY